MSFYLLLAGQAVATSNIDIDFKIASFKEQTLQSLQTNYPNAQFIELNEKQEGTAINSIPFASAPPLIYLHVYAAISTNHPEYEYFSPNQLISVGNHGGEELYIVTVEIGYGSTRVATMEGDRLSIVDRLAIDLNGYNIIDGWYLWWDASGYEEGEFTYRNTSSNSPWNTMTDKIYIR